MIDELQARLVRVLRRMMTRPRIDLPLAFGLFVLAIVGLMTLYSASGGSCRECRYQATIIGMVSLSSSDGWNDITPRSSQRLEPLRT